MNKYILSVVALLQFLYSFCASPSVTGFTPAAAAAGMAVLVTGTNFTGATAVSFGGSAAASFTVNSSTQITAIVGAGTSGIVQVITTDGTGS